MTVEPSSSISKNTSYIQIKSIACPMQILHCLASCAGCHWNKRQRCQWRTVGAIKLTWFPTDVAQELRLATHLGEGYSKSSTTCLMVSW